MPGNYFDQFDGPPQSGGIITLPPSPQQQRQEARQSQNDAIENVLKQQRIAEWKATHNPDGSPSDGADALDEQTKAFYAQQILAGGQMPSLGMGKAAAAARQEVMKEVARQAGASGLTGADLARQVAHYKAGSGQIANLEKQLGTIGVNEQTALLNGQQYLDRSSELPGQTDWPIINSVVQGIQRNAPVPGHETIAAADAALNTFLNEYGKVVSGSPNGSGTLSDSARHEAQATMQGNYSQEQKQAAFDQMKTDMANRMKAMHEGITNAYTALTQKPGYVIPDSTASLEISGARKQSDQPPVIGAMGGGGNPPPAIGGSGAPPVGGPSGPNGGAPLTPWQQQTPESIQAAAGAKRSEYDPQTSAGIDALVRAGRPFSEAQAYAASQNPGYRIDPSQYNAALAYARRNPNYQGGFTSVHKDVQQTIANRLAASPVAGYFNGASDALTAGYNDELAGVASALTGGSYQQGRDAFNAKKNILAESNPTSNALGNFSGGVMASMLGAKALEAAPAASAALNGMFGGAAPLATDAAYGGLYGSGENNDNRLGGAVLGAVTGAGAGSVGRAATRGAANVVAPPAGKFGPTYAQGVYPTLGQRFSQSGIAGRAINGIEQAMQSFPALGAMVARARQIPRDQFQLGGFNDALQPIGEQLPSTMVPGNDPHVYASNAFNNAYSKARGGMQFVPDKNYMGDLSQFMQTLDNGILNQDQVAQVGKVIQNSVGSRLEKSPGALNGDAYQKAGSEMDKAISSWSKDSTTLPMANALSDYQAIFDNAARRNSNPAATQLLDNADSGYARFVRLQNAAARGGVKKESGTFSPTDLLAAVKQESGGVRSNAYSRGQALGQDYAEAGRGLIDTLPNSGSAERLMTGQVLAGGAGSAMGIPSAIAAAPGTMGIFAPYVPGMNKMVTRAIAPRNVTLPPNLAAPLGDAAAYINDRSGAIGQLATAAALARLRAQLNAQ